MVSIFVKVYSLQYSESLTGSLFMISNIGPYMFLRNSLLEVFSNSEQNYNKTPTWAYPRNAQTVNTNCPVTVNFKYR